MRCVCEYKYDSKDEYVVSHSKFIEIEGDFKIQEQAIDYTFPTKVKLYACPWCGTVRMEKY